MYARRVSEYAQPAGRLFRADDSLRGKVSGGHILPGLLHCFDYLYEA